MARFSNRLRTYLSVFAPGSELRQNVECGFFQLASLHIDSFGKAISRWTSIGQNGRTLLYFFMSTNRYCPPWRIPLGDLLTAKGFLFGAAAAVFQLCRDEKVFWEIQQQFETTDDTALKYGLLTVLRDFGWHIPLSYKTLYFLRFATDVERPVDYRAVATEGLGYALEPFQKSAQLQRLAHPWFGDSVRFAQSVLSDRTREIDDPILEGAIFLSLKLTDSQLVKPLMSLRERFDESAATSMMREELEMAIRQCCSSIRKSESSPSDGLS